MSSYVALLRGIGPTNPNMRNEKLRAVFEDLGFKNVRTLISSGNVLFESSSKSATALEKKIEKALPLKLGFKSAAFVRSSADIERLIKHDPFKGLEHGAKSYLIVTFLKSKPREVFNALDMKAQKTTDFMVSLERRYGKEITTRTWKTVTRISAKFLDK